MSEMIERVARAICIGCGRKPDWHLDNCPTPQWHEYLLAARCAIKAMREPTTEMCNRGDEASTEPGACPDDVEINSLYVFSAMIDAALAD